MNIEIPRTFAGVLVCVQFLAASSVATTAAGTPGKTVVPAFCDSWSKLSRIDESQAGIMLVKCPTPQAPDMWCPAIEQMANPNATLRRIYMQRCLLRSNGFNAASFAGDLPADESGPPLGIAASPVQGLSTKSMQLYSALAGTGARRSNFVETTGAAPDPVAAAIIATQAQDAATTATATAIKAQQVALAQQNVGAACRYQSATVSFFAGLITLARAVKIVDNAKLGALLAPVAFSGCNKTVNATLAPITPVPPQTVVADVPLAQAPTFSVLEPGYSDAFNVSVEKTPGVTQLITVGSAQDPTTKKPLPNKFTIIPICSAFPSTQKSAATQTIQISDAYGQTTTVIVTVLPPTGTCPTAIGTGNS